MTSEKTRTVGPWGAYVLKTRARLGLGGTAFGKLVGVSRVQVHRWETGENVATEYDTIVAVADAVGDDRSVALKAAGQVKTGSDEKPSRDEAAIKLIRESDAPDWMKTTLIQQVREQSAEHERQRLEYVKTLLRNAGRIS